MKRFFSKVSSAPTESGCLLWLGAVRKSCGYGAFLWRGIVMNAHRAAWEIYNDQQAPSDMVVRHTCDNRLCVAPAHLVLGTSKDNTQDILSRGRWGYPKTQGERHWKSRLTEAQVLAIRSATGLRNEDIAKQYGVSTSAIAHIRARHNWRHLEEAR